MSSESPNDWSPNVPGWTRGKLSPGEVACLVSLLWFARADPDRGVAYCFPYAATAAATVGMGRTSWFNHLKSLEQKRVIKRTARWREGQAGQRSSEYLIGVLGPL